MTNFADMLYLCGTRPNRDAQRRIEQTRTIYNVLSEANKPMTAREILNACGTPHPAPYYESSTVLMENKRMLSVWEVTHALRRLILADVIFVVGHRESSYNIDGKELRDDINLYAFRPSNR